MINIKLKVSKK